MKSLFFKLVPVFVLAFQLASCKDRFSSVYRVEMPKTPEYLVSILGEPYWKLEFFDSKGEKQSKIIPPGQSTEIELPVTWTNPVTAWPYWPDYNLIPSLFKPAGALFPFDVSGERLKLSWEAGPDTVFYWELVFANSQNAKKLPANFDWPRFRELFKSGVLSDAVVNDPWLVDWRYVAEKTISSNFDRRRLVPQASVSQSIPVSSGPWYGASPFAKPLFFAEGQTPVFPVRSGINLWVSPEGILRVSGKAWVFTAKPSISYY